MGEELARLNEANLVVEALVKRARLIKLAGWLINSFLISLLIYWILNIFLSIETTRHLIYTTVSILMLSLLILTILTRHSSYLNINKINILEHINRQFPQYQESAQVILAVATTPMKKSLQVNVVEKIITDNRNNILVKGLPLFHWKIPVGLCIVLLLVILNTEYIQTTLVSSSKTYADMPELEKKGESGSEVILPMITKVKVTVSAPDYTTKKDTVHKTLNFNAIENSIVTWELSFNTKLESAFIQLGNPLATIKNNEASSTQGAISMRYNAEQDNYSISHKISETQIYHFKTSSNVDVRDNVKLKKMIVGGSIIDKSLLQSANDESQLQPVDGIYSIVIIKDRPPIIKIVTPKRSLTKISKTGEASFVLSADIFDDYGISNVEILASVAKGSGEAVKFRDKIFKFDEVNNIGEGVAQRDRKRYLKHWQLADLGMEPGDEVYFQVVAKDNRIAKMQTTKSSSVIVRWLDDEELEISADGIRIGFVAEYFRSQRQIIIETLELIEDKSDLSVTIFNQRSIDLGHSQNDLKSKYGQYLGDEFGESPGEHFGMADGYHGESEVNDASTSEANEPLENGHKEEHLLEHQDEHSENEVSNSLGDANALIAEFTHNHGTVEIAPLSKRDPKTWMKMAVNEMWQAELHLMLSEPNLALPFEKKAYKYLKEARKADRVYAKRLGFNPPPVTEERRLTGELDEVKTSSINKRGFFDEKSIQINLRSVYTMINQWRLLNTKRQKQYTLSNEELMIIEKLKNSILRMTKTRPILIKYAAVLEQIKLSKNLSLKRCDNCLDELQQRLWSLTLEAKSLPNRLTESLGLSRKVEKNYLNEIRGLLLTPKPVAPRFTTPNSITPKDRIKESDNE